MNRRRFLGSVARAVAAGGVAASAGCTSPASPSGPLTPPRSPEGTAVDGAGLVVADFADVEGDDGDLLVVVTVENRAGEPRSGVVEATVTAGSGDEERRETVADEVTVDGGERAETTLETSVPFETFSAGGSIRVDLTEN